MGSKINITRRQRITNTLHLNVGLIDNLGLMYRKMDIAIYFPQLAMKSIIKK